VALFDQRTDNPFSPREDQTGKGKDVLVGWLVGKAGVDFGVAQALAASDAQAAEQLKRLEETLVARISELQKEQKIGGEIPESYVRQLSALQAELQGFAKRISLVEAAGQQTERFGNHLRGEIAALKAALVEQQGRLQPADSAIRRVDEALVTRIQELQDQIAKAQGRFDGGETRLKEAFSAEFIALQAQLGERQDRLDARHSTIDRLLENVCANLQALEGWLSDKLRVIESSSGELGQIKSDMRAMAARMADVESAAQRAQTVVVSDAPTTEQLNRLEETLVVRIGELQRGQEIGEEVLEARARELSDLRAKLQNFAGRIGLVESAGQQTERVSDTLRGEIAALKFELVEQRKLEPADSVIRGIEAAHSATIQELQDQIAKGRERLEGREAQFTGIEAELKGLGGRLAEAESVAEQLRTWVKSETESAGKLSEGLRTEIAALRDQFHDRRDKDRAIEGIEATLGAKIEEFKNQVGQQMSTLEGRDGELTGWIKTLDQSFGPRMTELENQLGEKLRALEGGREETGHLRSELSALAERIARQEFEAQQARTCAANEAQQTQQLANSLKAEMAGLQADLNEQRQRMQSADSLIKGIEENLHPRIDQIGQHLAREQARVESVEAEFAKLRADLQSLVGQQERATSDTEQVRAWAAGEVESAAKLREGFDTALSALADRIARQELTTQQGQAFAANKAQRTQQRDECLQAEMAGLQTELKEQRQSTQLVGSAIKGIEENLNPRINQIGQHLAREQARVENVEAEFAKLRSDLQSLVGQQEQAVSGTEQVRAWAVAEAESAAKLREGIETELSALRARLDERQDKDLAIAGIEAVLGAQIEELQNQVGQKLSSLEGREDERAEWTKATDQSLSCKMQALEERLNEKLGVLESGVGELEQVKSAMRAAARRMAEVESAAQRAQTVTVSDAPTAEQMKRLEETLVARIGELQRGQKIGGEDSESRERELCDLRVAIQDVSTRMGRLEFAAHQTDQIGDTLRGEIAALKTEVHEQQRKLGPTDSMIRGIEAALSAKIEELQNQLGQKLSTADGRGELAELKATMQTITQRIAQIEPAAAQIQAAATAGAQAAVRNAMGSESGMVQRGEQLTGQPLDNPTTMTVESPRNPGEQSNSRDTEKEQLKQLQQRMSAEIERVRAELKEKSGRWKVRKGVAAP
jgi:chromosome segregation ATPase